MALSEVYVLGVIATIADLRNAGRQCLKMIHMYTGGGILRIARDYILGSHQQQNLDSSQSVDRVSKKNSGPATFAWCDAAKGIVPILNLEFEVVGTIAQWVIGVFLFLAARSKTSIGCRCVTVEG